jgi:hypothetical protein
MKPGNSSSSSSSSSRQKTLLHCVQKIEITMGLPVMLAASLAKIIKPGTTAADTAAAAADKGFIQISLRRVTSVASHLLKPFSRMFSSCTAMLTAFATCKCLPPFVFEL